MCVCARVGGGVLGFTGLPLGLSLTTLVLLLFRVELFTKPEYKTEPFKIKTRIRKEGVYGVLKNLCRRVLYFTVFIKTQSI